MCLNKQRKKGIERVTNKCLEEKERSNQVDVDAITKKEMLIFGKYHQMCKDDGWALYLRDNISKKANDK